MPDTEPVQTDLITDLFIKEAAKFDPDWDHPTEFEIMCDLISKPAEPWPHGMGDLSETKPMLEEAP